MADGRYWVFGYGSLIWNPGFDYVEARPALLRGAHRRLCIYSHHYRGTVEKPGLVYGLAPGGACRGMAYAVAPDRFVAVRDYLREREQVTMVYLEAERPIVLPGGESGRALTYMVDTAHEQYAGKLAIEAQWALVREAVGQAGANLDYVRNTARHLVELGIRDREVEALMRLAEAEIVTN